MANTGIARLIFLLLHALLNIILLSYVYRFDITASWLRLIAFLVLVVFLLIMFITHLVSFINFLKSKS